MKFKKGDRVKVWSLQSFRGGGFLNGEPAFVKQDQGDGDSVILCVVRTTDGEHKLDKSYEVYAKQCELVNENKKKDNPAYQNARIEFEMYYKQLMSHDNT